MMREVTGRSIVGSPRVLILRFLLPGCECNGDGSDSESDTESPSATTLAWVDVEDGESQVSVLITLEAVASGPLDAATVSADTVTLVDEYGHVVPAAITYDEDSYTIRLDPARRLDWGGSFSVSLAGIRDLDDVAVTTEAVSFTTYFNEIGRNVSYSGRDVTGYTQRTYLPDGRSDQQWSYQDPGDDGVWFTTDDPMSSWVEFSNDASGYDQLSHDDPGVDGTWLTGDDRVSYRTRYDLDAHGDLDRNIGYDAGPDGLLNTGDDLVRSWIDYQTDGSGNLVRMVSHPDAGADGTWLTADDGVSQHIDRAYDADGQMVEELKYTGPGDDGLWLTPDDPLASYVEFGSCLLSYTSPGPDGIWRNGDDVPQSGSTSEFDVDGIPTGGIAYSSAGADGTWCTDDDVVSSWEVYSSDELGNLVDRVRSGGTGLDGEWLTGDDILQFAYEYIAF